jgi:hypothetical protein
MKRFLIFSLLTALLGGCVVVPERDYDRGRGYYGDGHSYRGDGYYRGYDNRGYSGYPYHDHGG